MIFNKKAGSRRVILENIRAVAPLVPFHQLQTRLNDGTTLHFSAFIGKKLLVVNTASDCGYTAQYSELQQLSERFPGKLAVIAFPSNDFKGQESLTDKEIAAFCSNNYGVTFTLAAKSSVVGQEQNSVFRWLTRKNLNGWNNQAPSWNFCKYLVSESGVLLGYFDASISPISQQIINGVNDKG